MSKVFLLIPAQRFSKSDMEKCIKTFKEDPKYKDHEIVYPTPADLMYYEFVRAAGLAPAIDLLKKLHKVEKVIVWPLWEQDRVAMTIMAAAMAYSIPIEDRLSGEEYKSVKISKGE